MPSPVPYYLSQVIIALARLVYQVKEFALLFGLRDVIFAPN